MLRDENNEMPKTSRVCMTLTSSNGTWLNGCLQKQHYYVSLTIYNPDREELVRVGLSFEQAARMLMYNGDVECTLERYRDVDGRMGKSHESLNKRLEDAKRDLYDMVNGNKPRGKKALQDLMHDIDVIQSHFKSNQTYVVQQAEEEVGHIQSNAVEQLGMFIESKGIDAPKDLLTKMIPVSNQPLLTDEKVEAVDDDYELKERKGKKIIDMTSMEVGRALNYLLRYVEREQKSLPEKKRQLFMAAAGELGKGGVSICYINYQGATKLSLDEAKQYLAHLASISKDELPVKFIRHWEYSKMSQI